ncbi:MAG: YafY family transcriptional regulator [Actinobacteria bacterium]|nr:YafY family transcriptional regulator [Actinomycetota bacterium]
MPSGGWSTSARLLRLLSILQARPTWTANELAQRLDVTPRTVRRDVSRLRDLGYPVDAEPGPHGGYRLARGASLPPLLFEEDEAVAVGVGLRLAADGSVGGLDDAALSALTKLDQVLPAGLAARVRAAHEMVGQLHGRPPDQVAGDLFLTLAQACRQGERLRLRYTDKAGRASERRLDPYRLVHAGPRWYLVGRDVEQDAWRTLRLDRIDGVDVTRQRVEIVDPPDPVTLLAEGFGALAEPVEAQVRLPVPLDQALGLIPAHAGRHEPDGPDATLVTLDGPGLAPLARWLSALGVAVEVLHPPELRDALVARAEALVAANSSTGDQVGSGRR